MSLDLNIWLLQDYIGSSLSYTKTPVAGITLEVAIGDPAGTKLPSRINSAGRPAQI